LSKGGGPNKIKDRVKEELQTRYGGSYSDDELRDKAKEEMISKMEDMLANEGVDVNGLTNLMDTVSKRNKDIFQFPPYMLYVTRAFATLEGIGLSINEDYSILQECYPYLAKRLMSDDSPRSRQAMRNMLLSDGVISPKKLIEMSDGFTSYTASTIDSDRDGQGAKMAQDAFAELIFDTNGNLIQDLILEGAANVTDSLVREGYYRLKESIGGKILRSALKTPREIVDIFVPDELRLIALPWTLPLTLPYDVSKAVSNLIEKDESDSATIQALETLWKLLEPRLVHQIRDSNHHNPDDPSKTLNLQDIIESLLMIDPSILRKAIEQSNLKRIPGIARITRRYGASLMYRTSERLGSKKTLLNNNSNNSGMNTKKNLAVSSLDSTSKDDYSNNKTSKLANGSSIQLTSDQGSGLNNHENNDIIQIDGKMIKNKHALEELDIEERLNMQLLISILSSLTSATTKALAKALDDRAKYKSKITNAKLKKK
jgi:hypothetical protein